MSTSLTDVIAPFDQAGRDQRGRALWALPCWVVAGFMLGLGVPFAISGTSWLPVAGAYQAISVTLAAVGGMHLYGAVLAGWGVLMLVGITPAFRSGGRMWDALLRQTLKWFAVFSVGPFSGFIASWSLSGVKTWPNLLFWGLLGVTAVAAYFLYPGPPPEDRNRRVA